MRGLGFALDMQSPKLLINGDKEKKGRKKGKKKQKAIGAMIYLDDGLRLFVLEDLKHFFSFDASIV